MENLSNENFLINTQSTQTTITNLLEIIQEITIMKNFIINEKNENPTKNICVK